MTKKFTGFRLEPDLLDWLARYATEHHTGKTNVVEELLYALRENRIRVIQRAGPNAFPGNGEIEAGSVPEYPVLVAPSIRDQVGSPTWERPCGEEPLGDVRECSLADGEADE